LIQLKLFYFDKICFILFLTVDGTVFREIRVLKSVKKLLFWPKGGKSGAKKLFNVYFYQNRIKLNM
jgi:hypothetical protein